MENYPYKNIQLDAKLQHLLVMELATQKAGIFGVFNADADVNQSQNLDLRLLELQKILLFTEVNENSTS